VTMKRFTDSVEQAVASENYHAALAVALTLPDICGKILTPSRRSRERYVDWIRKYMMPKYARIGASWVPKPGPVITAEDFYALRCAYLHEGSDDLKDQWIVRVLKGFRFVAPGPGRRRHHQNDQFGVMELQVDEFCREVCAGVAAWSHDIAGDKAAQARLATLLEMQ
jgi:hypothetical protein